MEKNPQNTSQTTTVWPPVSSSNYPTLLDLVAMAGIFFVVQTIVAGIGMVVMLVAGHDLKGCDLVTLGNFMGAVSVASMLLTIIVLIAYRRLRRGEAPAICFGRGKFNPLLVAWSFVLMLAVGVVMEPLYDLLPIPDQNFGEGFGAFLAVVISAPLFEEIICRGMVFGALLKRRSKWVAMPLSALFFGILHVQPVPVINAFLLGLVLAFVYDRCQTIWAPILLHALNNGIAFTLMQLGYGDASMGDLLADHPGWYALLYGLSVAVALVSVWGMVRSLKSADVAVKEAVTTPATEAETTPAEEKIAPKE